MYHHYALARVIHAERLARGIAEREARSGGPSLRQPPDPPGDRSFDGPPRRPSCGRAESPPGPVPLRDRAGRPTTLETLP